MEAETYIELIIEKVTIWNTPKKTSDFILKVASCLLTFCTSSSAALAFLPTDLLLNSFDFKLSTGEIRGLLRGRDYLFVGVALNQHSVFCTLRCYRQISMRDLAMRDIKNDGYTFNN